MQPSAVTHTLDTSDSANLLSFPSSRILPVDLSDPEATRAATEKARELFGQIDILINNAGTCD